MKAVIFDMDYTLLDRERAIRFMASNQLAAFTTDGVSLDELVEAFVLRDRAGFAHRQEVYRHVADLFDLDLPVDQLVADFDSFNWSFVGLFDGVGELLASLRRKGIKLALLTNGSAVGQSAKINAARLRDMVDVVFISGERDLWKPDPNVFLTVCDELGTAPAETVMVGDTPDHDVIPAHELGMRTIWTVSHHPWPDDMPEVYDAKTDSADEMIRILMDWSEKEVAGNSRIRK